MTETAHDFTEIGFDAWRETGFESDYVKIDNKNMTITPAFDLDGLKEQGFLPRESKARFVNRNGYDGEREHAATVFADAPELIVASCRVGNSSSTYCFEGYEGTWNTVMFEGIPTT